MKCTTNGATIDPSGTYRYRLWRIWDDEKPRALFIMLNPSTADAAMDDPTIRRCISFAKREGCGGLEVVNLYAYRATSPKALQNAIATAPIREVAGPDNAKTVQAMVDIVEGPIICGWGAHGGPEGEYWLRRFAGDTPLFHLGLNKDGTPKHPLYIRGDAPLVRWLPAGEEEILDEDEGLDSDTWNEAHQYLANARAA